MAGKSCNSSSKAWKRYLDESQRCAEEEYQRGYRELEGEERYLNIGSMDEDAAPGKVVEGHFYDHWTEFFEADCESSPCKSKEPTVCLSSVEIKQLVEDLSSKETDWNLIIKHLRSLCKIYACDMATYPLSCDSLMEIFGTLVRNLRSQVIKETCFAFVFVVLRMGTDCEQLLLTCVPQFASMLTSYPKIVKSAVETALIMCTKYVHSQPFLDELYRQCQNKSPKARKCFMMCIAFTLRRWPHEMLTSNIDPLIYALRDRLADSDPDVRNASKICCKNLNKKFPTLFQLFYEASPKNIQKMIDSPIAIANDSKKLKIAPASEFKGQPEPLKDTACNNLDKENVLPNVEESKQETSMNLIGNKIIEALGTKNMTLASEQFSELFRVLAEADAAQLEHDFKTIHTLAETLKYEHSEFKSEYAFSYLSQLRTALVPLIPAIDQKCAIKLLKIFKSCNLNCESVNPDTKNQNNEPQQPAASITNNGKSLFSAQKMIEVMKSIGFANFPLQAPAQDPSKQLSAANFRKLFVEFCRGVASQPVESVDKKSVSDFISQFYAQFGASLPSLKKFILKNEKIVLKFFSYVLQTKMVEHDQYLKFAWLLYGSAPVFVDSGQNYPAFMDILALFASMSDGSVPVEVNIVLESLFEAFESSSGMRQTKMLLDLLLLDPAKKSSSGDRNLLYGKLTLLTLLFRYPIMSKKALDQDLRTIVGTLDQISADNTADLAAQISPFCSAVILAALGPVNFDENTLKHNVCENKALLEAEFLSCTTDGKVNLEPMR